MDLNIKDIDIDNIDKDILLNHDVKMFTNDIYSDLKKLIKLVNNNFFINTNHILKLIQLLDIDNIYIQNEISLFFNIITSIYYINRIYVINEDDIYKIVLKLYSKRFLYTINYIIKYENNQHFYTGFIIANKDIIINNESIYECFHYRKSKLLFSYLIENATYGVDNIVIKMINDKIIEDSYDQEIINYYNEYIKFRIKNLEDECYIMNFLDDIEVDYIKCPNIFDNGKNCLKYNLISNDDCCYEEDLNRFELNQESIYNTPTENMLKNIYKFTINHDDPNRILNIYSYKGDKIINEYLRYNKLPLKFIIYMYKYKDCFALELQFYNAIDFNNLLSNCININKDNIKDLNVKSFIDDIIHNYKYYESIFIHFNNSAELLMKKLYTLPLIYLELDNEFDYIKTYRGIPTMIDYDLKNFISFNSFTSTSIDYNKAYQFVDYSGTLLEIIIPNGNMIIPLLDVSQTMFPDEQEILLLPDTIFFVSDVENIYDVNTEDYSIIKYVLIVVNKYFNY